MKKIFLIASFITFSIAANAQMTLQTGGNNLTFKKSADFDDATVAGSKYFTEQYNNAQVNNGTQSFLIRYNAYADLMEYKNGSETLELIKEKNVHFVFQDGSIYELLNYNLDNKDLSRYHQILVSNANSKVSKYKSIKLVPAKKASNSYDSDTQATYKANKDVYFVTYNNQTVEFDGKEKTLSKLIPGKASEIKEFYKSNKIKENDTDMIKLGHFLATL
ncbi:hypothetical protein H1R17_02100 [Flavobacterium sp. xlx-214]|uniref:hypothetical protein n=1 Tax=unclassified Flavobacterium TaxID=196869 RepID=UPI0013D74109|nr:MULTISPECIES: hypothetical protein [unclassified Flavobacterium]MBA5792816.1 hypothetical protein [Flavobacterium sp. xlx-221]QMI83952.1 hypothetical protein H1R17_02100 [Flavobacterium sp. xlx-214]